MRRFLLTVSLSLLLVLPSQRGFAFGPYGQSCLFTGGVLVVVGSVTGIILSAILAGVSTTKACDPNSAFNTSLTVTSNDPCKLCTSWKSPNCCNNENLAGCRGTLTYIDSVCPRSTVYCVNENQTRIDAIDVRDWPSTYKYVGICLGMTAITAAVAGLLVGSCVKCRPRTPQLLPDDRVDEL